MEPPYPTLPKRYSDLSRREKLQADIDYYTAMVEYQQYWIPRGHGSESRLSEAEEILHRLKRLAENYDYEEAQGYPRPTTQGRTKKKKPE